MDKDQYDEFDVSIEGATGGIVAHLTATQWLEISNAISAF